MLENRDSRSVTLVRSEVSIKCPLNIGCLSVHNERGRWMICMKILKVLSIPKVLNKSRQVHKSLGWWKNRHQRLKKEVSVSYINENFFYWSPRSCLFSMRLEKDWESLRAPHDVLRQLSPPRGECHTFAGAPPTSFYPRHCLVYEHLAQVWLSLFFPLYFRFRRRHLNPAEE